MKTVTLLFASALLSGCVLSLQDDYDFVSKSAKSYYEGRGAEIVSYQGYNYNFIGRCYWYVTRRDGVTYESCLAKWKGEIHEYSFKAIDAMRTQR